MGGLVAGFASRLRHILGGEPAATVVAPPETTVPDAFGALFGQAPTLPPDETLAALPPLSLDVPPAGLPQGGQPPEPAITTARPPITPPRPPVPPPRRPPHRPSRKSPACRLQLRRIRTCRIITAPRSWRRAICTWRNHCPIARGHRHLLHGGTVRQAGQGNYRSDDRFRAGHGCRGKTAGRAGPDRQLRFPDRAGAAAGAVAGHHRSASRLPRSRRARSRLRGCL